MRRCATVPTALITLTLVLTACSSAGVDTTSAPTAAPSAGRSAATVPAASTTPGAEQYVANAADFVKAANWDAKKTVTI